MAALLDLPDELLQEIFSYLPASSVASLGLANKRLNKISNTPLLWRDHLINGWNYWTDEKEQQVRVNGNPLEPQWRSLYNERCRNDREALRMFDELLSTQQSRISRMEGVTSQFGNGVKDLLHRLVETPDDSEDVLARRYYSEALLGLIHRKEALGIWNDMQYQDFPRLERCLGAFSTFVQGASEGGEHDLDHELDDIATSIRKEVPGIDQMGYTDKASTIAAELRKMHLLGSSQEEYYDLRNNFILHVLKSDHRVSLPLVSTAIFCCIAQRFDLRAWPCNFPFHIHAVLESPDHPPLYETRSSHVLNPGVVWMDPWRHDNIIDQNTMRLQLSQTNVSAMRVLPEELVYAYLAPARTRDMALRTGRNVFNSVNDARDNRDPTEEHEIDIDAAFYSFLWSVVLIGWNAENPGDQSRNYIPYLLDHWKQHYPEDVGLVERFVMPLLAGHAAQNQLQEIIHEYRADDQSVRPVNHRNEHTEGIKFKVGQPFQHLRFNYVGIVVGWDSSCQAGDEWIAQMRVNDLPKGKNQSFYHIMGADKTSRYVAEENIVPLGGRPPKSLMRLAGRHFKRYDAESRMFISNMKDEYPDD